MSEQLPPELSKLGDQIYAAAARSVFARRRRIALVARLAATAMAGALALAVLAPGALAPADRAEKLLQFASLQSSGEIYTPQPCDIPHAATFSHPRPCDAPGTTAAVAASATALVLRRPYAR
jgi:hypothetical protein